MNNRISDKKGKLVDVDNDNYKQNLKNIYEAKTILEGFKDMRAGKFVDGDKAISDIRKKYGI